MLSVVTYFDILYQALELEKCAYLCIRDLTETEQQQTVKLSSDFFPLWSKFTFFKIAAKC